MIILAAEIPTGSLLLELGFWILMLGYGLFKKINHSKTQTHKVADQ